VRSLENTVSYLRRRVRELVDQLYDERQVHGNRMRALVRKNRDLSYEKDRLEKQLEEKTRAFSRQVLAKKYMLMELDDERRVHGYKMRELVRKNGDLSHEKGRLEKQLEDLTRAFSRQVSAREYMVMELKRQNTELTTAQGELKKQLDNTRKAGVLFMNAAGEYQEVVEREIRTVVQELKDTRMTGVMFMNAADEYQEVVEKEFMKKIEELNDTRKTGLLFMNAADEYQEVVEKESKSKAEELKDARMAGLLFMSAADEYQEVAEKEYKSKAKELNDTRMTGLLLMNAADEYQEVVEKEAKTKLKEFEELWAQKAEMDVRVASLELKSGMSKKEELDTDPMVKKRECEVPEEESDKLQTLDHQLDVEVNRHKIESCPLVEENEEFVKAFNVEKAENMGEPEYIKRRVEEIQAGKEFVEGGENDKLQLEVLDVEQKHSPSQAEVNMNNIELSVLEEATAKELDTRKAEEVMKELGHLERKVEETHVNMDSVGG
jgi:methylthioribose-1-phosphate isomerase